MWCRPWSRLELPRHVVGRRVEVYWAGDDRWYGATVMRRDWVHGALLLNYDDSHSMDERDWQWEPALKASMRVLPKPAGAPETAAAAAVAMGGAGTTKSLSRLAESEQENPTASAELQVPREAAGN